ncbi:MAG: DNA-binding protein, partial [Planctomycetaceae bacterium]
DDALADDDDLVIADDEDDLVLGGGASDISVSGDSGINLMSPSDSGLSLESEPLDLAGSSVSALDLGSEFGGGSGIGSAKSGRGSGIDFKSDEDFRLSPSGAAGDAEDSSQVIEIEDSSAFAEADAFGDAEFGEAMPVQDAFGDEAVEADALGEEEVGEDGFGVTAGTAPARGRAGAAPVFEVPFSIFQVSMLLVTLMIMSVGGMLMTDLLRNMWAYTDTAAPVSSLTDALVSLANLEG